MTSTDEIRMAPSFFKQESYQYEEVLNTHFQEDLKQDCAVSYENDWYEDYTNNVKHDEVAKMSYKIHNRTTVEITNNASDCGLRAWQHIFICFLINLSIQSIESFIDMGIHDPSLINDLDSNKAEAQNINNYFKSMVDVYAPIGMYVMTKFGYKMTLVVGSLTVCASFTSMSFLDSGSTPNFAWIWKIIICGPAGLGVSLLKVCSLIPLLEYFTNKRMEALLISKLGIVLGSVIDLGVKFAGNLDWQTLYRINAGFCTLPFVFALIMKDISVKAEEVNGKIEAQEKEKCEYNCIVQCFCRFIGIPVLKNKKMWTVVGLYSTFRFGTALPRFSKPKISKTDSPSDSYVDDLAKIIGILLGIILSYLLKKLKCIESFRKRKLVFAVSTISFACPIIGFISAVGVETVAYHAIVSVVLAMFKDLSENIRSESMPDLFGRTNIRITEGLLRMFIGFSGLIASSVQLTDVFNQEDDEPDWKNNFKIGGGSLIINGLISQLYIIYKMIRMIVSKKGPDNSDVLNAQSSPSKEHIPKVLSINVEPKEETNTTPVSSPSNPASTTMSSPSPPSDPSLPPYPSVVPPVPQDPPFRPSESPMDCPRLKKALLPPFKRFAQKGNGSKQQFKTKHR